MKLLHFGTFDIANYGDLLFPLVLERRLPDCEIVHAAPQGGLPVWHDCIASTAARNVWEQPQDFDGVIVGGGHIVSLRPTLLDAYRQDALLAYPSLWVGAAEMACRANIPFVWNAPGVADEFPPDLQPLVRWAASISQYVSVRDASSRRRLQSCGIHTPIFSVPDTAFDVCRLWNHEQIDCAFATAFHQRDRQPPRRSVAIHVSRRMLTEPPEDVARQLDKIAHRCRAVPILLSLGPVHHDHDLQREIAESMRTHPLLIDQPTGLCELTACIARSVGYVGSSLHGLIAARSFDRPAAAVISPRAKTRTKISDFMQRWDMGDRIFESWRDAAEHIASWPGNPAASPPDTNKVWAALDQHWDRLRHALATKPQSEIAGKMWASKTGQRPLVDLAAWQSTVLIAQAHQVPQLLVETAQQRSAHKQALISRDRALQDQQNQRRVIEQTLRSTEGRLAEVNVQFQDLQRKHQKLAARLNRHAQWIEDLEVGVQALLECRRWRVGNWLGHIWNKALCRPTSRMATALFTDIFQKFHEAQAQNEVGPGPSGEGGASTNRESHQPTVQIVVCVHNALEDAKKCLASIARNTADRHRVLIIDDASHTECRDFLAGFVSDKANWRLIRHEHARGYTRSANVGLRSATADYLILLNSDTIVPTLWVERLIACGECQTKIGIVGPLSNAASWQSLPERFEADGDWAVNQPPPGWTIAEVDREVQRLSRRCYPRVPLLNGFCMAIKRAVIDAIGEFDEEAFPQGYGEENDYCLRATKAGFDLAIADDLYIYHAKSRSYTHHTRRKLARRGQQALSDIHGKTRIAECVRQMRDDVALAEIRQKLRDRLQLRKGRSGNGGKRAMRIMFVLPVRAGGGGAHSVVQEADCMRRRGVDVRIAVDVAGRASFRNAYPQLADSTLFFFYRSHQDFLAQAVDFDIVVGTIYHSMWLVESVVKSRAATLAAYYVQDYEPFFFPAGSAEWRKACNSYRLLPNCLLFAKTDWLCQTVAERHGLNVAKVAPSLDHNVFYPRHELLLAAPHDQKQPLVVAAMIRPRTPRRGAHRTMSVLRGLKHDYAGNVQVDIFGCSDADLQAHRLPRDFEFHNHGMLTRNEVANLLRCSDVFLDLSDYQAFGRAGLEAMACGCATILPLKGGASEYGRHGENCLMVDTNSQESCLSASRELLDDVELRQRYSEQGRKTASSYSLDGAVSSELLLFERAIHEARAQQNFRRKPMSTTEESPLPLVKL